MLLFLAATTAGVKDPTNAKVTPFHLGLVGFYLSLITDQPWLCFLSVGLFASVLQGLIHEISGEIGTLPQLEDIREELSH